MRTKELEAILKTLKRSGVVKFAMEGSSIQVEFAREPEGESSVIGFQIEQEYDEDECEDSDGYRKAR